LNSISCLWLEFRKEKEKQTHNQTQPDPNSTQTQPKPPQHSAQPAWPGPAAQPATWAQSRSIPAPRPNPAGPAHSSSPLRAARFALAPLWPSEHARPARSAASPPSRCQPSPTRQGHPLPPAPPRALNGNHRDLRRGPAKHASPRSPACPLLAPHGRSPASYPLTRRPANPSPRRSPPPSRASAPPRPRRPCYAGAPAEPHAGSASTLGSSPSRFPPLRPAPTPVQPPSASSTDAPPPDDAAEHPTPATSFNTQLGEHPQFLTMLLRPLF